MWENAEVFKYWTHQSNSSYAWRIISFPDYYGREQLLRATPSWSRVAILHFLKKNLMAHWQGPNIVEAHHQVCVFSQLTVLLVGDSHPPMTLPNKFSSSNSCGTPADHPWHTYVVENHWSRESDFAFPLLSQGCLSQGSRYYAATMRCQLIQEWVQVKIVIFVCLCPHWTLIRRAIGITYCLSSEHSVYIKNCQMFSHLSPNTTASSEHSKIMYFGKGCNLA